MSAPIRLRDARRMLYDAGFTLRRTMGKHEVWSHPDGRSLSLPFTPARDGIRGFLAQKVRTYAAGKGLVYHRAQEGGYE